MKQFDLPIEFQALTVIHVQRVSSNEYSSECPQCGGEPHRGGELPDRFRMFLNAHGRNKVLGWCRRCGYVWFPNSAAVSATELEIWRQEQIRQEEERKRSAERAIEILKSEKLWLKYNEMLNQWAKDVIKSWGIREDWANFWRLGLNPDYVVKSKDGEYHSPAITIPLWQQNSPTPGNIK